MKQKAPHGCNAYNAGDFQDSERFLLRPKTVKRNAPRKRGVFLIYENRPYGAPSTQITSFLVENPFES